MGTGTEVLTAAELVARRAIGPPIELGRWMYRLHYAGSTCDVYLGYDVDNLLWRCEVLHDRLLYAEMDSLAVSYENARDGLLRRYGIQMSTTFLVQVYLMRGETLVLGHHPHRRFYTHAEDGTYTAMHEYSSSDDGTMGMIRFS